MSHFRVQDLDFSLLETLGFWSKTTSQIWLIMKASIFGKESIIHCKKSMQLTQHYRFNAKITGDCNLFHRQKISTVWALKVDVTCLAITEWIVATLVWDHVIHKIPIIETFRARGHAIKNATMGTSVKSAVLMYLLCYYIANIEHCYYIANSFLILSCSSIFNLLFIIPCHREWLIL